MCQVLDVGVTVPLTVYLRTVVLLYLLICRTPYRPQVSRTDLLTYFLTYSLPYCSYPYLRTRGRVGHPVEGLSVSGTTTFPGRTLTHRRAPTRRPSTRPSTSSTSTGEETSPTLP